MARRLAFLARVSPPRGRGGRCRGGPDGESERAGKYCDCNAQRSTLSGPANVPNRFPTSSANSAKQRELRLVSRRSYGFLPKNANPQPATDLPTERSIGRAAGLFRTVRVPVAVGNAVSGGAIYPPNRLGNRRGALPVSFGCS
jgi:hypothetical protein